MKLSHFLLGPRAITDTQQVTQKAQTSTSEKALVHSPEHQRNQIAKLNGMFTGYLDPKSIFVHNTNEYLLGSTYRYIGLIFFH